MRAEANHGVVWCEYCQSVQVNWGTFESYEGMTVAMTYVYLPSGDPYLTLQAYNPFFRPSLSSTTRPSKHSDSFRYKHPLTQQLPHDNRHSRHGPASTPPDRQARRTSQAEPWTGVTLQRWHPARGQVTQWTILLEPMPELRGRHRHGRGREFRPRRPGEGVDVLGECLQARLLYCGVALHRLPRVAGLLH